MLIRSSSPYKAMSHYLVDQIGEVENIEVITRSYVTEVHGEERLEAVTYRNQDSGESQTITAEAMFIFIGAVPHADLVKDVVEQTRVGFIITGRDLIRNGKRPKNWKLRRDPFLLESSVPGIFAAGDVRHGSTKRVASAVGEGSVCVRFVHQYLKEI